MNRWIGRRQLIVRGAALAGATALRPVSAARSARLGAVAFDGLALFDARPVVAQVRELFGEKGADLFRVKQFDYQWLSALAGRSDDFQQLADAALLFVAKSLKLELHPDARRRLNQAWLELKAWPDVAAGLSSLRDAGLRLAPLANFTPAILKTAVANSGLEGSFEQLISTGRARTFKPDPRAYQLGVDAFGVRREQILFVASAGWDAAGARWFGYPTFWINRLGAPAEELPAGVVPSGSGMSDLVAFVRREMSAP